jgi:hypothetical protein
MNGRRYKSYVHVSRVLRSDLFNAFEREVLLDAAEGLLLMRSPEPVEIGELEANVDATLDGLIAARRIHATTAAELRERICECGPESATLIAA